MIHALALAAQLNAADVAAKVALALGTPAYRAHRSLTLSGPIAMGGLSGTERTIVGFSPMRYVSADTGIGPYGGSEGYDGTDAWTEDSKGVARAERFPRARAAIVSRAAWLSGEVWLPNFDGTRALAGDQTSNGRHFTVLDVKPAGGSTLRVWVDDATWLPVRLDMQIAGNAVSTTFADYRNVRGAKIPFETQTKSPNGIEVARTDRAAFDVPDALAATKMPLTRANDFGIADGRTSTTVPFELINNHIYLQTRVNGSGPYRFIFDTGGSNIITPDVARAVGEAPKGSANITGIGNAAETMSSAKVKSVDVGGAAIRDQDFVVYDIGRGFGVAEGLQIDGMIGYEFASRFVTTIDYAHRTMTFTLPASAQPLHNVVPFVFNDTVPLVPGTVGGVSGWFELDTGSRAALTLFAPYLAEHPALRSGSHGTGTLGYGVGGGQIGGLGYVSSMRIGAFDFTNMYTNFSQAAKGALADPDVSGNIGGGVWKQFTLTLDYPHMRIGLQPNGTFNTPVAHDRSGLFVINKGGKVVVLSVFDGSPAAKAGIVAGDTIVEVGDESVKGTDLSAVRERFMQPPATKLRVVVETQGANRPVELTLAEYF